MCAYVVITKKKKKVKWCEKIFRFDFDSKIDEMSFLIFIFLHYLSSERKKEMCNWKEKVQLDA